MQQLKVVHELKTGAINITNTDASVGASLMVAPSLWKAGVEPCVR